MTLFRRFIFLAVVAGIYIGVLPPAMAQAGTDSASKYIQHIGDQALAIISNPGYGADQKEQALEKIFSGSVDFPWVGRFVMGHFWREATDAQKARYLKEYQKFLILHYTSRFTQYTSGSFKVTGARKDNDDEYTVSMQLKSDEPNSQPVMVDYRLRSQGSGFKIFDVIVEGVSLITTQRAEFSSVLTNNGIDYLIDQLAEKSKAGSADL